MKSLRLALCAGTFVVGGLLPIHAILDYTGEGLSYVWELQHRYGYIENDDDGDGATNRQEAVAGTDPADATSHFAGVVQSGSSGALTLKWPSQRGKEYRIQASDDLKTWSAFSGPFIGTGAEMSQPVEPTGAPASRRYWRVTVQDRDGDGDGLSDWEEGQLGTDPLVKNASPLPPAKGFDADRPAFVYERNGIFRQMWLGGAWPEQLFWEDVTMFKDLRAQSLGDTAASEAAGKVPTVGCVAWGFDLLVANGGDGKDFPDYSQKDGYKQYAAWMNPRLDSYLARTPDGSIAYPGQGFVSFGMPMLPEDLPAGSPSKTFGQWAGERVGRFALSFNARGIYGADGFIGLNYFTDWHPRLVDAFAAWAGQPVPGATVQARHDYIVQNLQPEYFDFLAHQQCSFYAAFADTLLAAGKIPLVGGQVPADPATARGFGNDARIWLQHIEAKHTIFMVETQAADDRPVQPPWYAALCLGPSVAYEPAANVGVMLDADHPVFWAAAAKQGMSREFGRLQLKQSWLTAGWVHVAQRDGTVRRAAQSTMRMYWDTGGVDVRQMAALFGHIPRHPFGPAYYYSSSIQRSYERPPADGKPTFDHYVFRDLLLDAVSDPAVRSDFGTAQGLNLGYFVSDAVDPAALSAANRPSAWLLVNADRLPAAERAKLEAIAPVIDVGEDPQAALAAGPLRARGSGLSCLAFVDQNGAVVVLVSNCTAVATTGSLEFTQVGDGTFACKGLVGTPNASLTIAANHGSLPLTVAARDTLVFVIPGLKWLGH